MCVCVCMYGCVCMYVWVCVCVCSYVWMHALMYTYVQVYLCRRYVCVSARLLVIIYKRTDQ